MTAELIKPKRLTKIDKQKALTLKMKGATYQDIAEIAGVSKQAVHQAISSLLPTDQVDTYKNNRADILANIQLKYLQILDDATIKKNLSQRGMTDIAILYDKERLERGMSTANTINIMADVKAIKEAKNVDNPVDRSSYQQDDEVIDI